MSRFYNGDLESVTIEWRKAGTDNNSEDSEVIQTLIVNDIEPSFTHYFIEEDKTYPTKQKYALELTNEEKENFINDTLAALETAIPENVSIENMDSYRDYTVILENTDNEAFIYPIPDGFSFDIDADKSINNKIIEKTGEIPLYILNIDLIDLVKNLDFYME